MIHINYHALSSFKNNTHILTRSSTGRKLSGLKLGSVLRVSQDQNQGVSWTGFLPGGYREESTSRLIQVVGRIQFLVVVVGLKLLFPGWLSSEGGSRLLEATGISLAHGSLHLQSQP